MQKFIDTAAKRPVILQGMTEQVALLNLTYDNLVDLLAGWGEPRYRADQLWQWVFARLVSQPAQMTNIPGALRQRLADATIIDTVTPAWEQRSRDRDTFKWLFRLPDGLAIETVLMLYPAELESHEGRATVCISSQAGCAMGCPFRATGQAGLGRNLAPGEIVGQVLAVARWLAMPPPDSGLAPSRLTNIVLMGMGEPMANYERVWQALHTLTDKRAFNLGARHITLSTVGLVPGIRRMAREPLQVNLAVSLHAPNDPLRRQLVPISVRYPLDEVMAAVREYIASNPSPG